MNKFCFCILLAVFSCVYLCGCPQSVQETEPDPLGGIKITDLEPTVPDEIPPQIIFHIYFFEMPAANASHLAQIFGGLYQQQLYFADYRTFEKNGLLAGFGRALMLPKVAKKMSEGEAKRVMMNAVMIFDDVGDDFAAVPINSGQTLFYTNADSNVTGVSFQDGSLVWNLRARPLGTVKGVANVQMEPVFRRNIDLTLARLGKKREKIEQNELGFAGFELNMSEEDFVLLGPSNYQSDKLTLSSLFFTGERKEEPVIRLYLIVCAEVSN
jgi:hypothetical protein